MPATRYGVSPWIDRARAGSHATFPAYRGQTTAPVVVIGGGLAGVMTAYACAAAGRRVVLLEADRLGHGGSGCGTGVCAAEATSSFRAMERQSGRRIARLHFALARKAVLELGATIKRLRLKAGFGYADGYRVATTEAAAGDLKREVEARREAGLEATWEKPASAARSTAVEAAGGARMSRWATCDPYRLVRGFAAAAAARGAGIHERSPVTQVTFSRDAARVVTAKGAVTAAVVIHCTGEPGDLVPALGRHVRPMRRGHASSAPLPAAMRKAVGPPAGIVTDLHEPPHVVRWTDEPAAIVAGADVPRGRTPHSATVEVARTGELMYELSLLYPAISGIPPAYGWSMPYGQTPDGGLLVGPHRNFPRQLFAFGTLHDPARAWLASRILLRHVLGEATGDDERFGFARVL